MKPMRVKIFTVLKYIKYIVFVNYFSYFSMGKMPKQEMGFKKSFTRYLEDSVCPSMLRNMWV